MIIGQKQNVVDNSAYFSIFFSDAISAAPPATVDESEDTYDAATVLVIETSHVRFLPACQGMSE